MTDVRCSAAAPCPPPRRRVAARGRRRARRATLPNALPRLRHRARSLVGALAAGRPVLTSILSQGLPAPSRRPVADVIRPEMIDVDPLPDAEGDRDPADFAEVLTWQRDVTLADWNAVIEARSGSAVRGGRRDRHAIRHRSRRGQRRHQLRDRFVADPDPGRPDASSFDVLASANVDNWLKGTSTATCPTRASSSRPSTGAGRRAGRGRRDRSSASPGTSSPMSTPPPSARGRRSCGGLRGLALHDAGRDRSGGAHRRREPRSISRSSRRRTGSPTSSRSTSTISRPCPRSSSAFWGWRSSSTLRPAALGAASWAGSC